MSTLGNSVGPKQWDTYDKAEVNAAIADGTTTALTNVYTKTETDTQISTAVGSIDLSSKQDVLVSGTNIKTINGASVLGVGDISTPTTIVNNTLTSTSITEALSAAQGKILEDSKQANLVSGTNIKTIAGTSILGSGDLEVGGGGLKSVQVFTSSGTWTRPAGITKIKVTVVGGGSGGSAQWGGSSGATAIKVIDVTVYPTGTVMIGAGGAGSDTNTIYAGGSSSFAYAGIPTIIANGGSNQRNVVGASASNGDINIRGSAGYGDHGVSSGNSFIGAGGQWKSSGFGADGQYGGGGGGSSAMTIMGGAGGAGIVIIEEYK